MSYIKYNLNPFRVPQTEPVDSSQKMNNAGGYTYTLSILDQFRRFLILGSEGGSYYATECKLTFDNIKVIDQVLDQSPFEAIQLLVQVSDQGIAPKNDQAVFALAKATCHSSVDVRKAAWAVLPKVCRIGTHLYQFAEFRKMLKGGWGRLAKDNVAKWFTDKSAKSLALQVAKYKQREGWAARDLIRLSHPKTGDSEKNSILSWVASKGTYDKGDLHPFLTACNQIQSAAPQEAINLINEFKLPREVLPTELLNSPEIWEALIEDMGMTALIRNLGKISSMEMTSPLSDTSIKICKKLTDEELLQAARIHPVNVLSALKVYESGRGLKGKLSWVPDRAICAALEDAFYKSFKYVEPTGKRILVGLDVSGSMSAAVVGSGMFSACEVASAIAMTFLRTEPYNTHIMGFSHEFRDLNISAKDSLKEVRKKALDHNFGNTDCALPMRWAEKRNIAVDAFIIITDNETYYGNIHPSKALASYRKAMGIDAKLVVMGVTATEFTIADPLDKGSLDVVGFDSSAPQIISEFLKGSF